MYVSVHCPECGRLAKCLNDTGDAYCRGCELHFAFKPTDVVPRNEVAVYAVIAAVCTMIVAFAAFAFVALALIHVTILPKVKLNAASTERPLPQPPSDYVSRPDAASTERPLPPEGATPSSTVPHWHDFSNAAHGSIVQVEVKGGDVYGTGRFLRNVGSVRATSAFVFRRSLSQHEPPQFMGSMINIKNQEYAVTGVCNGFMPREGDLVVLPLRSRY